MTREEATMLSLGPSPRLLHGPPDVRSSLGSAGIAGEVVVFKGPFNPVLPGTAKSWTPSCSNTSPHSAGSTSTSPAITSGRARDPLRGDSGHSEPRAILNLLYCPFSDATPCKPLPLCEQADQGLTFRSEPTVGRQILKNTKAPVRDFGTARHLS
jgi:hypothetical protein